MVSAICSFKGPQSKRTRSPEPRSPVVELTARDNLGDGPGVEKRRRPSMGGFSCPTGCTRTGGKEE